MAPRFCALAVNGKRKSEVIGGWHDCLRPRAAASARHRGRSLCSARRRGAHDRIRHYGGPALGVSKGLALPAQSAG